MFQCLTDTSQVVSHDGGPRIAITCKDGGKTARDQIPRVTFPGFRSKRRDNDQSIRVPGTNRYKIDFRGKQWPGGSPRINPTCHQQVTVAIPGCRLHAAKNMTQKTVRRTGKHWPACEHTDCRSEE